MERSPTTEMPGSSSALDLRPDASQGPLSFQASAWEYFGVCLLNGLLFFIPIFGWAGQWVVMNRFIIGHVRVEGRPLKYTMTYGYALKTIFGNLLVIIFTLGLGLFWLHVKQFQAIYAHAQYADEVQP